MAWANRASESVTFDCSEYGYQAPGDDEEEVMSECQLDECSQDEAASEDEAAEDEAVDSPGGEEFLYFRSNRGSIRRVLRKLGFKLAPNQKDASVTWNLLRAVNPSTLQKLEPWQRLGTIKGCNQFNNKLTLHRAVRDHEQRSIAIGLGCGRIMPRAFHALKDKKKLDKHLAVPENRCHMWICKPTEAAMGQGIFVCRNSHELAFQLKARKKYLHQLLISEYIEKPYLLRGVKFDLRVYVLVVSMAPLRVYVFEEGLVRYATTHYSSASKTAQLTNYSVNRLERNFRNATSMDDRCSHKQSFRSLKAQLRETGVDVEQLWEHMHQVLVEGVIAMHSHCTGHQGCFQLLGFDVLFDEALRPQILEVNVGLSLSLEASILDAHIKSGVVVDALNVIGVPGSKRSGHRDAAEFLADTEAEFARAEATGYVRVFPTPASLTQHVPLFKNIDPLTLALTRSVANQNHPGAAVGNARDRGPAAADSTLRWFRGLKASSFLKKNKGKKSKSKK